MFDLGLSYKDFARIFWTFVQGVLGYAILTATNTVNGAAFGGKAFLVGLAAAGVSAVKNLILSDNSPIK